MPFIPHTPDEVKAMLTTIGVDSIEDLFDEVPANLRIGELADVPPAMMEMEIARLMKQRAGQDGEPLCFIGAGAYGHHIPAAVWQIVSRGEYYSAYTPYQAEASQGTLQLVYEFQSMMTALTGMEVSNASLYDGASALAEAILMAVRANRKSKSKTILLPRTVNPSYRKVSKNIVTSQKITLSELPFGMQQGITDLSALQAHEGEDITAVVIQQPNFFGSLEEVDAITDWAHANGALVIAVVNPISLALLKPPGKWGEKGADIVVGEGQPLGVPLASGGPYFGFMCCNKVLVRQMPGRIVGQTVDLEGKRGFSLTLQAREQHIRRSKATSNICTNQGLMVTAATIHMSLLGPQGLNRVARSCYKNTRSLAQQLTALNGIESLFAGSYFHETVIKVEGVPVDELLTALAAHNVLGGYDLSEEYPELGNALLICSTEVHTQADFNAYVQKVERVLTLRCSGQCPVQPKF